MATASTPGSAGRHSISGSSVSSKASVSRLLYASIARRINSTFSSDTGRQSALRGDTAQMGDAASLVRFSAPLSRRSRLATDLCRPPHRTQGAMLHLRRALACALGALLLAPQPASAGGWMSWIHVDRMTVAPGERVEVRAEAWYRTAAAAKEAQEPGRFYVYLLRDFDYSIVKSAWSKASPGDWWSLGGADAIPVGNVTVSAKPDSNLGRARGEFTVPELPAATYHVMLCDSGCAQPLGTVVPARGFTVVADPATARLEQRVDLLRQRIGGQARELEATQAIADRALDAVRRADAGIDRLQASVRSSSEEDAKPPIWALAGSLVILALGAWLVIRAVRRRRPQPTTPSEGGEARLTDEELEELLSSHARQPR